MRGRRWTVEVDRFRAVSDNGKEHTIIAFQEYIEVRSFGAPPGKVEGHRSLQTSEGLTVNYIDPETFQIVETDEIVRKV